MNSASPQLVKLGSLGTFLKGQGIRRTDVQSSGIPCLRYGEIYTKFDDYTDSLVSHVSSAVANTAIKLQKGDIVFAGSGETKTEIGKCTAWIGDRDAVVGGDTIVLRRHGQDAVYLASLLNTAPVAKQKAARGQGDAVVHISARALADIDIALPSVEVQSSISNIIRDADFLATSLERLIVKKQAIKSGVMQRLLTGESRLPGHASPWAETRLGDLGKTYGGLSGKSGADFGSGLSEFITFMDVMANIRIDGSNSSRVRIGDNEKQNSVRIGDLLFNGSSETPEELALCSVVVSIPSKTYLNSFCFGFRPQSPDVVDAQFLAYLFRGAPGRKMMVSLAQGAIRYNISKAQFRELQLFLPCLEEQRAISRCLRDMDDELDALKKKLVQARLIKRGLMQELLTGARSPSSSVPVDVTA
jgi:type I restriction enzyme S subunit